MNPDLQYSSIPCVKVLQDNKHRIRRAQYSKRRVDRPGKESVSQAWRAIVKTNLLSRLPDHRIPPTPKPTTYWTCSSPSSLKPTGLRTLQSDRKKQPHSASFTPSHPPPTHPPTRCYYYYYYYDYYCYYYYYLFIFKLRPHGRLSNR